MEKFLSEYLFTLVFWLFFLAIVIMVIAAGLKTPKPRSMSANSPTKFVGKVRMTDMRPPDLSDEDKKKAQTVLEYLGGRSSAR